MPVPRTTTPPPSSGGKHGARRSGGIGHALATLRDSTERRRIVGEALRFGVVGVGGVVVDIALFNAFRAGHIEALTAKAMSTGIASVLSYFANRHWSFAHLAHTGLRRELPIFILLSAVALGIAEACLAISHYGLGYHSALADNVSANGIGLVLGTAWRFWSFKRWVFTGHPADLLTASTV